MSSSDPTWEKIMNSLREKRIHIIEEMQVLFGPVADEGRIGDLNTEIGVICDRLEQVYVPEPHGSEIETLVRQLEMAWEKWKEYSEFCDTEGRRQESHTEAMSIVRSWISYPGGNEDNSQYEKTKEIKKILNRLVQKAHEITVRYEKGNIWKTEDERITIRNRVFDGLFRWIFRG